MTLAMRSLGSSVLLGLLATAIGHGAAAQGAYGCVEARVAANSPEGNTEYGIASDEATAIVAEVADSIGLSASGIDVLSCYDESKAATINPEKYGYYIVYNPDWFREVMGDDYWQVRAVLAHELGHYLDGHWDRNKDLPRVDQETRADAFAGCAVARLGGPWEELEDLFSRIRRENDLLYPDRLHSLEALRVGYEKCGGTVEASVSEDHESSELRPSEPNSPLEDADWAAVCEGGAGIGYVWLGQYLNDAWTKTNFYLQGLPERYAEITATGNVNIRASLPLSVSQMGSEIGRLSQGQTAVVCDIARYSEDGNSPGQTWAKVVFRE